MIGIIFESAVISLDSLGMLSLQRINRAKVIVRKHIRRIIINDFLKALDCVLIVSHLAVSESQIVRNFCPGFGIGFTNNKSLLQKGHRFFKFSLSAVNSRNSNQSLKILVVIFLYLFKNSQSLIIIAGFDVEISKLHFVINIIRLFKNQVLINFCRKIVISGKQGRLCAVQHCINIRHFLLLSFISLTNANSVERILPLKAIR